MACINNPKMTEISFESIVFVVTDMNSDTGDAVSNSAFIGMRVEK